MVKKTIIKKKAQKNNKKESDSESETESKIESKTEFTMESETELEQSNMESEFDTISIQIKPEKMDILSKDIKSIYSSTIDFPAINLGFQHYIHQSYSKNEIFSQFENRKKIYNIINDLEVKIDDYDKSIESVVEKKYKTKIVDEAFYQLIEMGKTHKFLDQKSNITTLHINDKKGGFAQAVMLYRKSSDKINVCSTDGVNILDKSLKLSLIKDPKNLKADLITAYGEHKWKSGYTAESEAFGLIIDEIQTALKNQKEGGTFVLKMFETFTNVSCKIIEILCNLYDKVYLVKPMTSRTSESEKFLVCTKFKENKNMNKILDIKTGDKLVDLFPEHNLSIRDIMIKTNIMLSNRQYICLNRMFKYIQLQNFFGDEYHKNLNNQKKNSEKWLKLFSP